MTVRKQKYSVEFREQAVRRVIDGPRPIADVGRELGVQEGTLSNWVRLFREANPVAEKPLTISERARLIELEKEVRDLRLRSEFLGKAAAFFAQEYR